MIDLPQAKVNSDSNSCYEIEAVVSFDERGQLVLPKDLRKKFKLNAGEKFLLASCSDSKGLCCLTLVKTNSINHLVGNVLNPFVQKIKS